MSSPLIGKWIQIGKKNHWIRSASDPDFDERSFVECKTVDELERLIRKGGWCLGQAFYIADLCFINQDDGGDEWLVIHEASVIESISGIPMVESGGLRKLIYKTVPNLIPSPEVKASLQKEAIQETISELEEKYPTHYPNKPVGGSNPYWKCIYCDKTDPQISIDQDNGFQGHRENCEWFAMRSKIAGLKRLL